MPFAERCTVKMKNQKTFCIKLIASFLFFVVFIAILIWINQPLPGDVPTAASQIKFAKAHVTKLISDEAKAEDWTEGLRIGVQEVYLQIDSGEDRGKLLPAVNYMSVYNNVDLKVGTKVIARLDIDANGRTYIASIPNYNRGPALLGLTVIFVLFLAVFGGKKGIAAILGLAFAIVDIWFLLIPMIRLGINPILSSIVISAVTTAISLVLLNGFSMKTFCATIGCVGGVAMAGAAAALTAVATPINGFNMSEAEELVLRTGGTSLNVSGLLISAILIAALGAVMDVAMTITSAVFEVHQLNPELNRQKLIQSGINIGRDAMGTMANTLILAFAGSALNMLILFRIFDYPYLQIFNSDMMALEIIQGISGSIGIVMTVPLVAFLSAFLCSRKNTVDRTVMQVNEKHRKLKKK
ncbi:YibE/F family protein [Lacrimispora celerecrescens]|uniref:YibE/F family protein n=2 Tax=Lacrimispora celerecrescens TaxID=29354 RepID=A0A084JGE2_9FIRM|nr:YibE/F family protein [Lacrimispora celerecrescens]